MSLSGVAVDVVVGDGHDVHHDWMNPNEALPVQKTPPHCKNIKRVALSQCDIYILCKNTYGHMYFCNHRFKAFFFVLFVNYLQEKLFRCAETLMLSVTSSCLLDVSG